MQGPHQVSFLLDLLPFPVCFQAYLNLITFLLKIFFSFPFGFISAFLYSMLSFDIFTRPGVAKAVLQTPPLLVN